MRVCLFGIEQEVGINSMTYFYCHIIMMMLYYLLSKIVVKIMNKNPSTFTQISTPVLQILKKKFQNYDGTPFCQVQISHRSKYYQSLNTRAIETIKKYFNAENYQVLLMPPGSAMGSIFFNLTQENTQIIFYSQGQFSNFYYQEMKKYHPSTQKTNNWQIIKQIFHNQASSFPKIVHYNKVDFGKKISSPIFTQLQRNNMILIKNVNYCFPDYQNTLITEDIVYFETQKGFGIPGFTVMLIKNQLLNKLQIKSHSPDMFDFLLMSKMKSVVNTPFTLCTFVLYENINYCIENKEKIYQSIQIGKRNYSKLLKRLGFKQSNNSEQGEEQSYNFIRRTYTQNQEEMLDMFQSYGWVCKQLKIICLYIQNQNQLPIQLCKNQRQFNQILQ